MKKITLENNLEFFDETIKFWKATETLGAPDGFKSAYSDDIVNNIRQALMAAKFQPQITTDGNGGFRFDYLKNEYNYAFFVLGEKSFEVMFAENTEFPSNERASYAHLLRCMDKYGKQFSVEEKPEVIKTHSNLEGLIESMESTYKDLKNNLENLKEIINELKRKNEKR